MGRLRTLVAVTGLVATAVACGPAGSPPELGPIGDQTAAVGQELVIVLTATDKDGDALSYGFSSDVPDIQTRADMSLRADGAGVFRWTPLAGDVGGWFFDFTVTDGVFTDTRTIRIDVRSAVGQNTSPVFRQPLGTGTTLDLAVAQCLTLDVVVEDPDSSSVIIAQDSPVIDGATLTTTGGLTAMWMWCPSERQIDQDDRYTLTLSADDLTNPKTIKHYLIVLRRQPKPDCPGDPPVVTHTPMDASTVVNLTIDAQISDDLGLKRDPLFYYSTSSPSNPVDLGAMTQLTMSLVSGDMRSGTWAADVPNPVASSPAGTSATLYYVIVANDDDDLEGDCDHVTQAPSAGTYQMTVQNPGGDGGAGLCESCTADVQCGAAPDLCVRVGTGGDSFCLRACEGAGDCPAGYECSESPVSSVGGVMSRQCVPTSGTCGAVAPCDDDVFEDNDDPDQADAIGPLDPGSYDLTSCPLPGGAGDDEDWFALDVSSDADVTVHLVGGSATDLDLGLYDAAGIRLASSVTLTSDETVGPTCLEPGIYYVRVYAWGTAANDYTLDYTQTPTPCIEPPPMCTDDEFEDDDDATEARLADIFPDPFVSETNAICSGDDDWFEIELYDGETVVVDLTFEQTTSDEDLDLHFIDAAGLDLTPCTEDEPLTCSADQGQSVTSNEHYEHTLDDASCLPCTFFVVVHGWNGAENLYDIQIALQ